MRAHPLLVFLVFTFAIVSSAQSDPPKADPTVEDQSVADAFAYDEFYFGIGDVGASADVTQKPFCADIDISRAQALPDGNKVRRGAKQEVCRDSEGRVRTSTYLGLAHRAQDFPDVIIIIDPVANIRYELNPRTHKALKRQFRNIKSSPSNAAPAPTSNTPSKTFTPEQPRPMPHHGRFEHSAPEQLGSDVINGLDATGVRQTITIPAGKSGNELPIVTTVERWFSAEINEIVLTKTFDPRVGETAHEMKNVITNEPDPSLFQLPADYTIEGSPAPPLP